jgi:hypothetical protein
LRLTTTVPRTSAEQGPRYWMLETIREYAASLLDRGPERPKRARKRLRRGVGGRADLDVDAAVDLALSALDESGTGDP